MTLYLLLIYFLYEVMKIKKISKYFVFVSVILFALYVSSLFVPSLSLINMPTSTKTLVPLAVLFTGITYYGVMVFMEKNIDEKLIKLLLLSINILPYENMLFSNISILLLVFFEIYERSVKAGFIIKSPLLYSFVFLPLIIYTDFELGDSELINVLGFAFVFLLFVDLAKISFVRLIAVVVVSINVYSLSGNIFLIIMSSLSFITMFILSELFRLEIINKRSLNKNYVTRIITKFMLVSEMKEKRQVLFEKQYKPVCNDKKEDEYTVTYFNDVKANFVLVLTFFAIMSLFIIFKGA